MCSRFFKSPVFPGYDQNPGLPCRVGEGWPRGNGSPSGAERNRRRALTKKEKKEAGHPDFSNVPFVPDNMHIFDIFVGEGIPNDKKSVALNVTIQSMDRTLNDKDLEKINKLIIDTVQNKTGAKIRS